MARNSKLLAALDAHKGRDYKLEKQKRLQKQAMGKKKSDPHVQISGAEDGLIDEAPVNGSKIEGWESSESENAVAAAVSWGINVGSLLPLTD